MSLVYIFAASPAEAEPVRKIAAASGSSSAARCGANDVVLIVGGMGPLNAKRKAEAILVATADAPPTHKPDAVLVIGLCGGLTDKLPEGGSWHTRGVDPLNRPRRYFLVPKAS